MSQSCFSYFKGMFLRKKPNKSGKTSIQVIEKNRGKYTVLKTIGSSSDPAELKKLVSLGEEWMRTKRGLLEIPFNDEKQAADLVLESIERITVAGTELLLDRIFNEIGFNAIKDDVFKWLVYSRICFPASKLKTCDYLHTYHGLCGILIYHYI